MNITGSQTVGWTAIIGGIVGVIGFISLILLFVVGEPFGTINDVLAIPTAVLMIPLVVALYRLNVGDSSLVSTVALLAGAGGFLATSIGSILLVTGRIDFEQSLIFGIGGFGLIGLWVLLNSVMGLRNHTLPGGLAWVGFLLGLTPTFALLAVFRVDQLGRALSGMAGQTAAGFEASPLVYLIFILGFISYAGLPIWFILMGRLFLSGWALLMAGSVAV